MEADLTKDLYRIGTKNYILNSWYARNQFSICTEGTVNIADVPSVNISLRECAGKASLFGGQGYGRCNCKTLSRSNLCSCRKLNKLYNSKCHNSLSCENNDICFDISSISIEVIKTVFVLNIYFFMKDILNVKNTNKKHLSNIQPNIFISDKISKHSTKCVYKQCNN